MSEFLLILIAAALVNNVVLTRFLGVCPFVGGSQRLEIAFALALSTSFVLVLATVLAWLLDTLLLTPLGAGALRLLAFLVVIAATVQLTELLVRTVHPMLHEMLGLQLPLVASNCAVLGITLLNARQARGFVEAVLYGVGAAAGFSLALVLFAGLRERVDVADVPEPFKGAAIALVTAGLMALAFLGFEGLATE